MFRIQSERYPQLVSGDVKVYLAGDFNQWEEAIGKSAWELQPAVISEHAHYDLIVSADELPVGHCSEFKFVTENGDWLDVPDSAPNRIEFPAGQ